jgi:hypothetical protein
LAQGCDTVQLTQVGTLDQATKAIESRQPPHAIVTDLALSPGGREGETIAEQAKAKNIPVALGTLETDSPNLQNVDLRLVDKNDFPTVIPQLTEWLIKVLNL